jgi:hypothetical protein
MALPITAHPEIYFYQMILISIITKWLSNKTGFKDNEVVVLSNEVF